MIDVFPLVSFIANCDFHAYCWSVRRSRSSSNDCTGLHEYLKDIKHASMNDKFMSAQCRASILCRKRMPCFSYLLIILKYCVPYLSELLAGCFKISTKIWLAFLRAAVHTVNFRDHARVNARLSVLEMYTIEACELAVIVNRRLSHKEPHSRNFSPQTVYVNFISHELGLMEKVTVCVLFTSLCNKCFTEEVIYTNGLQAAMLVKLTQNRDRNFRKKSLPKILSKCTFYGFYVKTDIFISTVFFRTHEHREPVTLCSLSCARWKLVLLTKRELFITAW